MAEGLETKAVIVQEKCGGSDRKRGFMQAMGLLQPGSAYSAPLRKSFFFADCGRYSLRAAKSATNMATTDCNASFQPRTSASGERSANSTDFM